MLNVVMLRVANKPYLLSVFLLNVVNNDVQHNGYCVVMLSYICA
jgi:hypothetical protein